uniref:Stress-response A/B barrel domain-containing protein n=1 Tax=Mycena chlorophos TaxID=658473 RepID=A0ABQ0LXV1_MYCCL|nr:predicted protein [Mycena chlorophos]
MLETALLIPGVNAFRVGPPLVPHGARGYQVALAVEFEDLQAFREWLPHPHHRLMSEFINSLAEEKPLSYQIASERVAKL